jgi:hypothetical protein
MNPHFPLQNGNLTQLKDGRWVPAQPLPYYRDGRNFLVKLWHSLFALKFLILWNKQKADEYEDWLEKKIDAWLVPVEPHTDDDGNWRYW